MAVSDLDELFLAEDGRSIFDHAQESLTGIVRFRQRFIEPIVKTSARSDTGVRFSDYVFFDSKRVLSTPKYAAILARLNEHHQLLVHSIGGDYTPETDAIVGRQFEAMKLAWDRGTFDRKHPDIDLKDAGKELEVDEVLRALFNRVAETESG